MSAFPDFATFFQRLWGYDPEAYSLDSTDPKA